MLNKEYEKMTFDDLDLKNDLKVSFVLISDKAQYDREIYLNDFLYLSLQLTLQNSYEFFKYAISITFLRWDRKFFTTSENTVF